MSLTSLLQIISSHEFSQDMLDEKLKENERRRRKAVKNVDLEMSQYLEDERLAIALQNSEFLQELRGNEDFMKTLEKGISILLLFFLISFILIFFTKEVFVSVCLIIYIKRGTPNKITSCIGSGPPIFFYDVFLDALNTYAQCVTQLDNLTGCEK